MEYSYNELVLCGNVAMRWNLCGPIKPSSWLKASYWWMISEWNQYFIPNVRFSALRCRSTALSWWNKHGTSPPSRGAQTWLVWDGWRLSGAGCQETRSGGWRGEGAATLLCIRVKCLRSEMAAPAWIHIQTLHPHTNKQTAYGHDVRGVQGSSRRLHGCDPVFCVL